VLPSGKVGFLVGDLAFAYSRHVASLEPERNQCPFFFGPLVGKDLLSRREITGCYAMPNVGTLGGPLRSPLVGVLAYGHWLTHWMDL
jgi:hypothetical protein